MSAHVHEFVNFGDASPYATAERGIARIISDYLRAGGWRGALAGA